MISGLRQYDYKLDYAPDIMNIAFCVAAHTDPLQLDRLLKRLFRIGDVR